MAKLITTAAEKAAASYLDWDDVAVGRLAKKVMLTCEKLKDNKDGKRGMFLAGVELLLIQAAHEMNAGIFTMKINGHTHKEIPTGDWLITVKQIRKPNK